MAEDIIHNPELFELLFKGLSEKDDLVRGRTAHALEKISRVRPELFKGSTVKLIELAKSDHLPFVLWHLAMLFVNLKLTLKEKKGNNFYSLLST